MGGENEAGNASIAAAINGADAARWQNAQSGSKVPNGFADFPD